MQHEGPTRLGQPEAVVKAQKGFDERSNPALIPFAERVGQVVSRLRAADGSSQNEAAARLGLKSAEISRLLRAHHDPGLVDAIALATKLNVSAGWLLAGEGVERSAEGPADRARSAAVALGFHPESIERGLSKAEADDSAWQRLEAIQKAESKRPGFSPIGLPLATGHVPVGPATTPETTPPAKPPADMTLPAVKPRMG